MPRSLPRFPLRPPAAAAADAAPTPGEVAAMIRSHLSEHGGAADTAAGIQRFWIAPVYGEVALDLVEQALDLLAREALVRVLDERAAIAVYARGPALPWSPHATPRRH